MSIKLPFLLFFSLYLCGYTLAQEATPLPTPEPVLLFQMQAPLSSDEGSALTTFEVYGDRDDQTLTAYGINIVYPQGTSQLLDGFESILPPHSEADALIVEDFNFDGYADLRMMEYQSGSSTGVPYFYWLYQPQTETFVASEAFRAITSPEVDTQERQIRSRTRASSDEVLTEYFNVQLDSPILYRREVRTYSPDGSSKLVVFTAKTPGGSLQLSETRTLKPGEEP